MSTKKHEKMHGTPKEKSHKKKTKVISSLEAGESALCSSTFFRNKKGKNLPISFPGEMASHQRFCENSASPSRKRMQRRCCVFARDPTDAVAVVTETTGFNNGKEDEE